MLFLPKKIIGLIIIFKEKQQKMIENEIEYLAREIVNIAYKIHFSLGPGLLESVYEVCFCYELEKRNIAFISQKKVLC